jgi:hypothetical protein
VLALGADFLKLPIGKTPALFRLAFLTDAPKVLLEKQVAQVVDPKFLLSRPARSRYAPSASLESAFSTERKPISRVEGTPLPPENALDERDRVQRLARLEAEFGVLLGIYGRAKTIAVRLGLEHAVHRGIQGAFGVFGVGGRLLEVAQRLASLPAVCSNR